MLIFGDGEMHIIKVVNVNNENDIKNLNVYPNKQQRGVFGGTIYFDGTPSVRYMGQEVERSSVSGHTVFRIDGGEYIELEQK